MDRYAWDGSHPEITALRGLVAPERAAVLGHPVYRRLRTVRDVNVFMAHHVFAVWDFMSLLKSLQRDLTCVSVPWTPRGSATGRRLVNEIVLVEESDALGDGFLSHFELYVAGMEQSGADTVPIMDLLSRILAGNELPTALETASVPTAAAEFTKATWELIHTEPLHCRAAAFAFSREDLIPEMFDQVAGIDDPSGRLALFRDYLSRHIEVDSGEHTPMAMRMVVDLCGDDPLKWKECGATVARMMLARVRFWDGIMIALEGSAENGLH